MAVTIESVGVGVQASDTTEITITAPSGIQDGDLLIAGISKDGGSTNAVGLAGWASPTPYAGTLNFYRGTVLYKIASSESGDYTFTWSGNEQASGAILRISGHHPTNFLEPMVGSYVSNGGFMSCPHLYCRFVGGLWVGMAFTDGSNSGSISSTDLTEHVDQNSSGSNQCHLYVCSQAVTAGDLGSYIPTKTSGDGIVPNPLTQDRETTFWGLMINPAGVNPISEFSSVWA